MAARLLLVHSPLVGCARWDLVAADLAGGGYELGIPDLTSTVMAGPPHWLRQAQGIAPSAPRQPPIPLLLSGDGPPLAPAAGLLRHGLGVYLLVARMSLPAA